MCRTLFAGPALLLLLACSCKSKKDPEPVLPNYVINGNSMIAARINGKAWVQEYAPAEAFFTLDFGRDGRGPIFQYLVHNSAPSDYSFLIYLSKLDRRVQTVNFHTPMYGRLWSQYSPDSAYASVTLRKPTAASKKNPTYVTNDMCTGWLTITYWDTTQSSYGVAGRFAFRAQNEVGDTVRVDDGRFYYNPLKNY